MEKENEVRVIKKLCAPGAHNNIVEVLGMGELFVSQSGFYFIDMELCETNLAHYMSNKRRPFPRFVRDVTSSLKATQIWNVMTHISRGVEFIHGQKEIHRDLKPSNSTPHAHC
jgi:serine/threonine protein kinase